MRTLTHYEVAWNMHQAQSTISQICQVVQKDRSTIYRWLQKIKRAGIRKFLANKKTCKQRRPKACTPQTTVQKIVDIRNEFGWCGAKIRKELKENHGIKLGLSTIYRWLHRRFTKAAVGIKRYKKHQAMVTATKPREVVEHDTVDLGGNQAKVYAYTAIDIFTKEPCVIIADSLEMETGAKAFAAQKQFYGAVSTHQSDNGSEFQTRFVEAVTASGAQHRYSRPYKKNEQSHIENFNKALRSECFPRGDYETGDIPRLQQQADEFTKHYIERRWHMGLPDLMTPRQFTAYYERDPASARLALAEVYGLSQVG